MKFLVLLLCFAAWAPGWSRPVQEFEDKNNGNTDASSAATVTRTISGDILNANKDTEKLFIDGDIAFPKGRSSTTCTKCLWEKSNDGTVNIPFVISPKYINDHESLIRAALEEFGLMTCARFVQRTKETDYLSFEPGNGCWSFVGKKGGKQTVSLSLKGCISTGIAQHEAMHALGFYHEHTRQDRDNYIDIIWENMAPADKSSFLLDNGATLDIPYDYNSIMHYNRFAYSNNGKPTMVPKPDPNATIGIGSGLNNLDIMKINTIYNCDVCRTKLLNSSGSFSGDVSPEQDTSNCLWLVQTTFSSKKVFLQFSQYHIPTSPDCSNAYIKIYDGSTKSSNVLLDQFCGKTFPPIVSNTNVLLIEVVNNQPNGPVTFSASYNTLPYGGTYTADDGIITSPLYPSQYFNDLDAVYMIFAPPGLQVNLTFTFFQLEPSKNCENDRLVVFNGPTENSSVLGTFCGFNLPSSILSTNSIVRLLFHTDPYETYYGFSISYKFVNPKSNG